MIDIPQIFLLLVSVIFVLIYMLYHYVLYKSAPTLAKCIELSLAILAAASSTLLVVSIFWNHPVDLGDANDSLYAIVLGGFAVIWVSITTTHKIFKSVPEKPLTKQQINKIVEEYLANKQQED